MDIPRMEPLTVKELIKRLKKIEDKTAYVTVEVPMGGAVHKRGLAKGMTTGVDPDFGPCVSIWAGRD